MTWGATPAALSLAKEAAGVGGSAGMATIVARRPACSTRDVAVRPIKAGPARVDHRVMTARSVVRRALPLALFATALGVLARDASAQILFSIDYRGPSNAAGAACALLARHFAPRGA